MNGLLYKTKEVLRLCFVFASRLLDIVAYILNKFFNSLESQSHEDEDKKRK